MAEAPHFQQIADLRGHAAAVYCLAAGNHPWTVFSGSADRFVAEWNLETLQPEKFSVKLEASVYSLCHIVSKGLLCIGLSSGALHVIDLKEKREVRHIRHHQAAIFDICYDPFQDCLYTVSGEGWFCVWNAEDFSLQLTLPLCEGKIRKVALHPSGKELALACADNRVRILEASFYNEIHLLEAHRMAVCSVAYNTEGNLLFSGGKDAWLHAWKTDESYRLVHSVPAHNYAIYAIVEDPDQRWLATGSRDKTVKIWEPETLGILRRLDRKNHGGHAHSVNTLYWSGWKNRLVSAGDDASLKVWEESRN